VNRLIYEPLGRGRRSSSRHSDLTSTRIVQSRGTVGPAHDETSWEGSAKRILHIYAAVVFLLDTGEGALLASVAFALFRLEKR
jgi:hypothetical protein